MSAKRGTQTKNVRPVAIYLCASEARKQQHMTEVTNFVAAATLHNAFAKKTSAGQSTKPILDAIMPRHN